VVTWALHNRITFHREAVTVAAIKSREWNDARRSTNRARTNHGIDNYWLSLPGGEPFLTINPAYCGPDWRQSETWSESASSAWAAAIW
jgi:hypothetical protein